MTLFVSVVCGRITSHNLPWSGYELVSVSCSLNAPMVH